MQILPPIVYIYKVEMEYKYPDHLTRAEALARRADKLHGWLQRDEYAVYQDENSVEKLVQLIDLIVYALEVGLPDPEWRSFHMSFKNCRLQILDVFETQEALLQNYSEVISELKMILEGYKDVVIEVA